MYRKSNMIKVIWNILERFSNERVSNHKTSRQIYFMYDMNAINLIFSRYSIQTFDLYAGARLTDFKSKSPIPPVLACIKRCSTRPTVLEYGTLADHYYISYWFTREQKTDKIDDKRRSVVCVARWPLLPIVRRFNERFAIYSIRNFIS